MGQSGISFVIDAVWRCNIINKGEKRFTVAKLTSIFNLCLNSLEAESNLKKKQPKTI